MTIKAAQLSQAVGSAGSNVTPGFAEAHRKLVADSAIQFDLPGYVAPKIPGWMESVFDFFRWLSPAFPYLFWGAIGVAVLGVLYLIFSGLRGATWGWPWRRKGEIVEEPDWRPAPDIARALLAEAEALAAQGRFAEAARLLLRRSVEDIARYLPEFLKPSLTARDIATAEALPSAARPAFASIAYAVEVSAFGSRAVTAEAWAACREAYGQFALKDNWRRKMANG